jgi:hypothetical protein
VGMKGLGDGGMGKQGKRKVFFTSFRIAEILFQIL